jgi:hypothetical protein
VPHIKTEPIAWVIWSLCHCACQRRVPMVPRKRPPRHGAWPPVGDRDRFVVDIHTYIKRARLRHG